MIVSNQSDDIGSKGPRRNTRRQLPSGHMAALPAPQSVLPVLCDAGAYLRQAPDLVPLGILVRTVEPGAAVLALFRHAVVDLVDLVRRNERPLVFRMAWLTAALPRAFRALRLRPRCRAWTFPRPRVVASCQAPELGEHLVELARELFDLRTEVGVFGTKSGVLLLEPRELPVAVVRHDLFGASSGRGWKASSKNGARWTSYDGLTPRDACPRAVNAYSQTARSRAGSSKLAVMSASVSH